MRERFRLICSIAALAVGLVACEHTDTGMISTMPKNISARLDAPDPGFRLTAEQRASVAPGFDVDALERLLAVVHPDLRRPILSDFAPHPADVVGGGLMKFEDPVLQALLDEVWAPRWDNVPEEWLNDPEYRRFPGQRIARMRRAARADSVRSEQ